LSIIIVLKIVEDAQRFLSAMCKLGNQELSGGENYLYEVL